MQIDAPVDPNAGSLPGYIRRAYPRNPIGVIALFVSFIEAIATISLKLLLDADSPHAIAVVYFFIGFPLGVYLEERRRLGQHASTWRSTREAVRAMGLSIVIELSAPAFAAGAWLAALLS